MSNDSSVYLLILKLNALDQKISMLDSRIEGAINLLRTMINDDRILYQLQCKILAQTATPTPEQKEQPLPAPVPVPPVPVVRQPSPTEFWNIPDTLERGDTVFPALLPQSWLQTPTHPQNTQRQTQ